MAYDFELTFTGLCVFVFKGKNKRLPEWVDVLLIKADDEPDGGDHDHEHEHEHEHSHGRGPGHTPHFPTLSFSFDNVARGFRLGRETSLFVGPNGHLLCSRDLSYETVTISTEGEPLPLRAVWRPDGEEILAQPRNKDEEEWLDWVPGLQQLSPSIPPTTPAEPFVGLDLGSVVARVTLTAGILQAAEVVRRLNNRYIVWDFKEDDDVDADSEDFQAIADQVILRIPDATGRITLRGLHENLVQLSDAPRPGRGVERGLVQASITNLPREEVRVQPVLQHFSLLSRLIAKPGALKLPHARNGVLDCSSSSICPGGIRR